MFKFKCRNKNDSEYPSDLDGVQLQVGDTIEYNPIKLNDVWGSHQVAVITEIIKKNDNSERNWRVMVKGSALDECEVLYFRWKKTEMEGGNV